MVSLSYIIGLVVIAGFFQIMKGKIFKEKIGKAFADISLVVCFIMLLFSLFMGIEITGWPFVFIFMLLFVFGIISDQIVNSVLSLKRATKKKYTLKAF